MSRRSVEDGGGRGRLICPGNNLLQPSPTFTNLHNLLQLEIPQYLVGSRDVREEDPVAQPVERHPQRGEALSGGAVNGGDAEVLGEPVLRGEPKALSTRSEERRVGKECRSRWSPDH